MPYKEAIKLKTESNSITPIQKAKYKVVNWPVYNKSLRNRGKLSLYFPKGDLRSQFINDDSYSKGTPGRAALYSSAYIEIIFIHYRLFGWGIRQITGYFEEWLCCKFKEGLLFYLETNNIAHYYEAQRFPLSTFFTRSNIAMLKMVLKISNQLS